MAARSCRAAVDSRNRVVTYGQLVRDAYVALQAAGALALGTRAAEQMRVAGVLAARERVLRELVRLVWFLRPARARLP
jgi:hypothetical protein